MVLVLHLESLKWVLMESHELSGRFKNGKWSFQQRLIIKNCRSVISLLFPRHMSTQKLMRQDPSFVVL